MVRTALEQLLFLPAGWVYLLVALLVFAEDAIFVGFVIPGESAALLAGVDAQRGHLDLAVAITVVVAAAIAGDAVGYQVGRRLGARLLDSRALRGRRGRIDAARDLLARRGGAAVFAGRFVAFFRAVMPALAGSARMPYRRFAPWNAAGALVWGAGFVLVGHLAGASYQQVAAGVGRSGAIVVAAVVLVAVVAWRVRRARRPSRSGEHVGRGGAPHTHRGAPR